MGFKIAYDGELADKKFATRHQRKKKTFEDTELPLTKTRLLMAFLGALPCQLDQPYWPTWNLKRSCFMYCIVIYTIATAYNVCVYIWGRERFPETSKSISYTAVEAMKLESILLTLPHFFGIILWLDVKNIVLTLKAFTKVQATVEKATGKTLANRRKTIETVLIVLSVFLPIFLCLSGMLFLKYVQNIAYMIPVIIYGNILITALSIYFMGYLLRVADAAEDIKRQLIKLLRDPDLTATTVFDCRMAWLSMRTALDSMGAMYSQAVIYYLSLISTVVLLYEAGVMFQIRETFAVVLHILTAFMYVALVGLSSIASHFVEKRMKCLVRDVLPTIKISAYNVGVQREVVMLYFVERARPAVTKLDGMITLNKHLMLMFFSSVSTYIIVLMQFFHKDSLSL